MHPIRSLVDQLSRQARKKRANIFRRSFNLDENTRILDLGSEDGTNVNALLEGTSVQNSNVYIADIDSGAVEKGSDKFGFVPVFISESERLPFEDKFFDIVYCSLVIEHVTASKNEVWKLYSRRHFKAESVSFPRR